VFKNVTFVFVIQLSAVHNIQGAFDESLAFSRYHPSKGYSWDFKDKSLKASTTTTAAKKESEREEVSSMFQRQRVDMLLRELTNRYPPKIIQQPAVPAIEQQKQAQPGNSFS
jgi:mediator of RNA polymerase II transcription subunit 6